MTAQTETTVERWTYAGRRRGANGVLQAWITPTGERYFAKLAPSWARPGAVFEITQAADGSGVFTRGERSPRYVQATDGTDVAEWIILDGEAELRVESERKGKLAASLSALDDLTVAEIRALYLRQRTKTARAVLVAKLLERVVD